MKLRLMLALFVAAPWWVGGNVALAESALTPKAQYEADSKKALARYEDDKKLCNDEASSSARLQCRRDAKTEYDKALADAKVRMGTAVKGEQAHASCTDCGKVTSVQVSEKEGEGSAVGMVAGGAVGALLGNQLGGGFGKDVATVAGAVGGAYAGKEIEKRVKTHKVWAVGVQYKDGSRHSFEFQDDPGLSVGDTVRKSGDSIVRY
jgi:uncharacterized protein YcfJ